MNADPRGDFPSRMSYQQAMVRLGIRLALEGNGITIQGEWNNVWDAVLRCRDQIDWEGEPPIAVTLKVDPEYRPSPETPLTILDMGIGPTRGDDALNAEPLGSRRPARPNSLLWRTRISSSRSASRCPRSRPRRF